MRRSGCLFFGHAITDVPISIKFATQIDCDLKRGMSYFLSQSHARKAARRHYYFTSECNGEYNKKKYEINNNEIIQYNI